MLSKFLEAATQWAHERDDIVGLALIGSHARDAARPDSDVDLFVLCENSRSLIDNKDWTARFGDIVKI